MENNLLKKFAAFLREAGEIKEAEKIENIIKGIEDFVEEGEAQQEEIFNSEEGTITIADCRFVICAVLPDNKVYPVNVDSDEIADFLVAIDKFQVIDQPIGTVEPVDSNVIPMTPMTPTKNKYLD